MDLYTLAEIVAYVAVAFGAAYFVRYRLRKGRLIQYNLDMGPPTPDTTEYEQCFVCFYRGNGRGGGSTVLPSCKAD